MTKTIKIPKDDKYKLSADVSKAKGEPITLAKLEEAFAYFQSEEYHKACYEEAYRTAYLQVFFAQLHIYGLIDVNHYMWYLGMITSGGYFMAGPKHIKELARLEKQLKKVIKDADTKKFLWPEGEGKK
jgi:hypothetical protein